MKLKFCPKCGNTSIEDVTEKINDSLLSHYSAPRIFKCKRCGFENQIFPEKEIKTNLKQRQKLKDKQ
ncbi:MAG: hypothetical protein AABY06_01615 [Nanoarchaeota archaeon]